MLFGVRLSRFSVWRVFMVGGLGLLVACGPSLRMIHESGTYYERCFSADVDPQVSVAQRRECWARWLEHYTQDQPADRIAHAQARHAELEVGIEEPPLPGAPPRATPQAPAAATDVDAEADADAGVSAAPGSPPDSPAPDSAEVRAAYRPPPPVGVETPCDPICRRDWEQCIPGCDGRSNACEAACRAHFLTCQAGCY